MSLLDIAGVPCARKMFVGLRELFVVPRAYDEWAAKWRQRLAEEATSPEARAAAMRVHGGNMESNGVDTFARLDDGVACKNPQSHRADLQGVTAGAAHTGFVFDGGVRDQEGNREIPDFNGTSLAIRAPPSAMALRGGHL